jgi:hypothetical protein
MNNAIRCILVVGALNLAAGVGCGGARSGTRTDATPGLLAYGRAGSDVAGARPARANAVIRVDRVPEEIRRDPMKVVALRRWMMEQIAAQARDIPEERYQRLVRPGLRRAMREAGLSPDDVDYILRDVDYHRGL